MRNPLLLPALCLFTGLTSQAQDTAAIHADSTRNLREITIYQAQKTTPVTFQNLDIRTLKEKNTGQEPSFLLSETPSVTVYSDAGNQQGYSYYRLRGIDQTRINTTLDGMPLNEPEDQGAYFSNYPDILSSVSKLQLQRGTGTSKNGAASYAGSLQLFSPDLQQARSTSFTAGYGAWNSFRLSAEYNSGVKNRKAFYARASEVHTDGYKEHAFNHSQSAFLSGAYFGDKSTWKLNLMAGHQQNGMAWLPVADSLIKVNRRANANTKAEKDEFLQSLVQLQHQVRLSEHASINSSVYYTYLNGGYGFDVNNFMGQPSDGNLFHYNFRSHFTGIFSNYNFTNQHFNWTTGIHGNIYSRRHLGKDDTEGELYRNTGYKNEISAFTKLEYHLQRFTLYGDLQYRYTTFNYSGSVPFDQMHWAFLNPRAGVSFSAGKHTSLYYSIGNTGREPTRNDIFGGNDDLATDEHHQPLIYNSKAESVTDQELGVKWQYSKLSLQFNGYYMKFRNEIVLNGQIGPNGLLLTNNVSNSFRTGLELSATYQPCGGLTLTNNSSWNYSRIKEDKTTFSPVLTPALIINQEAAYRFKQVLVGLSARYQGKSYIDFANTASIQDYVLLNARIQYMLSRYTFSFFLNNLTNKQYYNNGAVDETGAVKYFVQAPRNLYFAVRYSF
ncbi:iron complex outermembrane receptor protein [Chitinophaga dinghuensis]|uniref:Iron complex outermembrane receptor protein n=1 Tax=Chitinophaga dinghuensis TaxID=1539050 RepID=A0A327W0H2_9BACT|nr:TonB-dependent receptor [Chitinophaga dinghuensis]RAJ77542.1 iron complex outermembrane receptor protein [Chitinophaga dinghuensis]